MVINNIRCCYMENPSGITEKPVISWQCDGFRQNAYLIHVSESKAFDIILYDSGWISSDKSVQIELSFELKSRTRYYYKIKCIDDRNKLIESKVCFFETGLLYQTDFKASWIQAGSCESPIFQKTFFASNPSYGRVYMSGLGYSYLYVNGQRVTDSLYSPVWSDYHKRDLSNLLYPIKDDFSYSIYYKTFDITDYLKSGENTISIALGNGFYNQYERSIEGKLDYGKPKLFLQAYIDDENGTHEILSDKTFLWKESSVLSNSIYFGEKYDSNFSSDVWNEPLIIKGIDAAMRPQLCPDDKVCEVIKPTLLRTDGNKYLYDAGRNLTGVVRLITSSPKASIIKIRYAETSDFVLKSEDNQMQEDEYVSSGKPNQIYMPMFVWHGFQYFEVTGEHDSADVLFIHTDVRQTGKFRCSSDTLNFIYNAYINTQLCNLHSGVPSDCPHRERLGYTGDGQITSEAAIYSFDMGAFYTKWIQDIIDGQCKKSGHVQHTSPFYGGGGGPGGWGSAIVIIPYNLYKYLGDINILKKAYLPMKNYIDYMLSRSEDNIVTHEEDGGWCLGDWSTPEPILLPESFVNTYYLIKCIQIMQSVSDVLSETKDKNYYVKLEDTITESFMRHFYDKSKNEFCEGLNGSTAFAADIGLAVDKDIEKMVNFYKKSGKINTGIFGTPILIKALIDAGQIDLALNLMEGPEPPSFGYMMNKGATTLWETWSGNTSLNHPMFGSVVSMFYRYILGIQPGSAGFKEIIIAPIIPSSLTFAEGEVMTPYGKVKVCWNVKGSELLLNISIPCNTEAVLKFNAETVKLSCGNNSFKLVI